MVEEEKYGIFGDIHANDVALEEAVHDAESRGIRTDHLIILGDTVDYNANSERCARLVAESGAKAILGNHGVRTAGRKGIGFSTRAHYAAFGTSTARWNDDAEVCNDYTVETLSDDSARYLANLPLALRFDHSVATHAGLLPGWNYFNQNPGDGFNAMLAANMAMMMYLRQQPGNEGVNVCFVAHSHTPGYVQNGVFIPATEGTELDVSDRNVLHDVDAGSVGQPRDGDPRASWLEYDPKGIITFRRTAYDIDKIAAANIAAGLPDAVSERLFQGN